MVTRIRQTTISVHALTRLAGFAGVALFTALLASCGGGSGGGGEVPAQNLSPRAYIHPDRVEAYAGVLHTFSPTSSYDPDGSIVKYEWDMDFTAAEQAENNPSPDGFFSIPEEVTHVYDTVGIHTVRLEVTDNEGATDVALFDIVSTDANGAVQVFPAVLDFDNPDSPTVGDAPMGTVYIYNDTPGPVSVSSVSSGDTVEVTIPDFVGPVDVASKSTLPITVTFQSFTTLPIAGIVTVTTGISTLEIPVSGTALPGFARVGDMNEPRRFHTATRLLDGRVLITGGEDASGAVLSSVEVYDLDTRIFTLLPGADLTIVTHDPNVAAPQPRRHHTATLMDHGTVLVMGGDYLAAGISVALDSGQVFDPASDTWVSDFPLYSPRTQHTATHVQTPPSVDAPLGFERVLLVGGYDLETPGGLATAAVYASNGGLVSLNLASPRVTHAAVDQGDGTVLVVGGIDAFAATTAVEVIDIGADTPFSTPQADLSVPRWDLTLTRVTPEVGDPVAIAVGGGHLLADAVSSLELFDMAGSAPSLLSAQLAEPRRRHVTVALNSGRGLLVVGGLDTLHRAVPEAERIAADGADVTAAGNLRTTRSSGHRATLLIDGSVLVTGGGSPSAPGGRAVAAAELYVPEP